MKKNTKEKILNSARELFSRIGYDGSSVDAIAEKAAVNKASIYYYYNDKASLYERVFEEDLGDFLKRIRKAISKQDSPEEKLRAYIFTFSENFQSNQYMAPLMLRELASDGRNLSANSRKAINNIIKELDKILKNGISSGSFKNTKTLILHIMIVGSMNIFISTKSMRKNFKNPDNTYGASLNPREAAGEIASVVLDGIKNRQEERRLTCKRS